MAKKIIYVTGPFGAPIMKTAERIANEQGMILHDLDKEIEIRENWSVKRMVMMHGEHCYRNAELDALKALQEDAKADLPGLVVACGDGILYDEDSRAIIEEGQLEICGMDMTEDELWSGAVKKTDSYHAFMSMPAEAGSPDEADKRERFHKLIERQKELFREIESTFQEDR
ncbi:MAG: hypothetical protein MJ144_00820 [Clostridia bacterium]|nr:hypothetical protein [Clostridia bacterium]